MLHDLALLSLDSEGSLKSTAILEPSSRPPRVGGRYMITGFPGNHDLAKESIAVVYAGRVFNSAGPLPQFMDAFYVPAQLTKERLDPVIWEGFCRVGTSGGGMMGEDGRLYDVVSYSSYPDNEEWSRWLEELKLTESDLGPKVICFGTPIDLYLDELLEVAGRS